VNSDKSMVLPFENRKHISCLSLSPNGALLLSIDEGIFIQLQYIYTSRGQSDLEQLKTRRNRAQQNEF
jgi:hypothetical protein